MIDKNNKTIGMISLGCSKNQIDAERLLAMLRGAGYRISSDPRQCGAVIINTCGFIDSAKQEAIAVILEFAAKKQEGMVGGLIVTGCLPERYREEFVRELPEVDGVLGIGKNAEIVNAAGCVLRGEKYIAFGEKEALSLEGDRLLAGAPYSAYLKIAEGCDNRCGYCAIPDIRGRFRSRPLENIVEEARTLIRNGVVEINLVAQDTTRYGEDIYGKLMLPELLNQLCEVPGLRWLRLLYCYPDRVTDELLDVMREQPKIVKYMDLPVQHASGKILRQMNRSGDEASLRALIQKIRQKVPGIALRTTLIAGFPGESEEDFETLCRFVQEMAFDRLGCFAYSQEENTPAGEKTDQLDEDIKRRRAEIIMETQAPIAAQKALEMAGREIEVICEGYDIDRKMCVGRSQADAPDIDTKVYFPAERIPETGTFLRVRITGADGYDLLGIRAC